MVFFDDKKKKQDNVKTLSETEIQQRLYGHLRLPSTTAAGDTAHDMRRASILSPPPPSGIGKESGNPLKLTPASPDVPKSGNTTTNPKSETGLIAASVAGQKQVWTDTNTLPQGQRKPSSANSNRAGGYISRVLISIGGILKTSIVVSLGFLLKLILGFFHVLLTIDFRKPHIKRLSTVVGAIAFIGLLFLSTHFLNVNREVAMKSPRQKAPVRQNTEIVHPSRSPEIITADGSGNEGSPETQNIDPKSAVPAKKSVQSSPASGNDASAKDPEDGTEKTVKAPEAGAYSIQVATFAAREDAQRLVSTLSQQRIDAFIKTLERPGGKTYFCVFVGRYKDYRTAEENLGLFKRKNLARPFQDAFVRALKNQE